jgi:hypothetical protein
LLALFPILPQAGSLRPGLPRVTWSTDHFSLTIDEKKADLLPALGSLAEECYAKQKVYFGYEPPGKIQMVFLDEQDYANGFAYSAQKWVVIYLHAAEHQLRGRTRWLPGVISHELGHVFTLRKMGDDSRYLGIDFFHDWRGASGSRFREGLDWAHNGVPPWLAEGLAQYAASVCGYDTLDTHRRMVLRVAAASGGLMTLGELKGFAWDGRRNEMLYTQGYSLVTYIFRTFGQAKANRYLALAATRSWRFAFKPAFGKDIEEIYRDWRKTLESRSRPEDAAGDGDYLLPEPAEPYAVETSPVLLKDGEFLYLSAHGNDYGTTDLYLADGKGSSSRLFRNAASLRAADGGSALFTATRFGFLQGDVVSELYRYDANGSIERLTHGGRVIRGCENQGIVYGIRNDQGRTSLIRIAEGEFTTVFTPPDSMELTDVAPGHAPGTLTLGATSGFGGDLYELDLASRELSPLAISPQDERDPVWNGGALYFSADYGGVFDIYAQKDGQVDRITHVSGGAFHPAIAGEDVWFSSYGWKGFRLARAKPPGGSAPPFVVELPVPAWKPPPPAEYEADTFDHTNMGFLGFNLALGLVRTPGFFVPADASGSNTISSDAGTKALAEAGFHWKNPSGSASALLNLGLAKPVDYEAPMRLDETAFEVRVDAFLPTLVVGGAWNTYDYAGFKVDTNEILYYQRVMRGYAGLDWRLAEHWSVSGRAIVQNDFAYAGEEERKVYDSDPRFGGTLDLDWFDLDYGKDGITQGYSASISGEITPKTHDDLPDYSGTAGLSFYESLRRILFLKSAFHFTQDMGDGIRSWAYGSASAYCAIPLGIQLGTRGGVGAFLDAAYPGIDYAGLGGIMQPSKPGAGYQPGYLGSGSADRGGAFPYSPVGGFRDMVERSTNHELGVSLSLKALTFFANPGLWTVALRFDAQDFGRDPVWRVFVTL